MNLIVDTVDNIKLVSNVVPDHFYNDEQNTSSTLKRCKDEEEEDAKRQKLSVLDNSLQNESDIDTEKQFF